MFHREDASACATQFFTQAKIPAWKDASCASSLRAQEAPFWTFARTIATALLQVLSLRRTDPALATWDRWKAGRLRFQERSPLTMAVLKSLFAIRIKFACRNSGSDVAVPCPRKESRRPRSLISVVLTCAALSAMRLAASQQPANPAAISPPTANTAASQAAIELVNEGNGLLDHKDFAGGKTGRNCIDREGVPEVSAGGRANSAWRGRR